MRKSVALSAEEQLLIIKMPLRLRGTYITWRLGFEPYFLMSRETYYRHARELSNKWGIDITKVEGKP
tara:strand:+ start:4804 stop:5004 length:201 start_codon:yes stop_codon:yes gene_type:complete